MFYQIRKRYKLEAERKKKQYETIIKSQQKKKEELIQNGEDTKKKPGTSDITPLSSADPFKNKFTGSTAQGQLSKIEVELFTIGRQLIGQLDSKMVAIETLTLEANRAANRLELLIEHFEQITNKLENNHKNTPNNVTKITPPNSEKSEIENIQQKIEPQPVNFTDYLSELEIELNDFQDKVDEFGGSKEVTILRAVSDQDKKLPDQSANFTRTEIKPAQITPTSIPNNDPFALSAPRFPGDDVIEKNIPTKTHTNNQNNNQSTGLSIDTLFNDSSAQNKIATNANNKITLPNRKQIEMLANYGYSIKEIAQNLNIPIGEVDLILNTKK
ncbi:MAG: hypothetical protein LBC74_12205 [Planctomycetaceae bacterium]|jgi:hypothetical protein|nr:hypothetical protein [Planctomycetaceae bacterium]